MIKNMKGLKCGGKMYIILVYDVSVSIDNGNKNLTKIYKICKKYLSHIQNSVFEGEITESNLKKLQLELKQYIRKDLDSVIIFKSREQRWLNKEFWGKEDDLTSNFL